MSLFPVAGTPPAMVLTREGNGLFSLLFGPLSLNLAPLVRGYFFGDSLPFLSSIPYPQLFAVIS